MRLLRIAGPLVIASLLGGRSAQAGPWTKSLGQAYVKVWEGVFLSDSFVGSDGRVQSGTDHVSFTTALYAEVGIWDRLHLQLFVPHVVGRNTFESGSRYLALGGGDLLAGLQWSSPWIPIPHGIRVEAKVPMYDVARVKGFEATRFPARGDGQVDFTLWLTVGGSIPNLPIYLYGEIGHRFRTEVFIGEGAERAYQDSFAYQGQIGVTPFAGIVFAGNVTGVQPYAGDDLLTKAYLNLGVSIYAPVWRGLALEANFDGTVYAKNSAPGLSFGGGISYNFQ